jgi:hypothetical protein
LARDYERKPARTEAMIKIAMKALDAFAEASARLWQQRLSPAHRLIERRAN